MKEYRNVVDKSSWPRGPWDSEPDKVQWTHAGVPCLIVRGPSGALCGYAGVEPGHLLFGVEYGDNLLSAHGGITFSDFCQPGPEDRAICHIPEPGQSDRVWWLGFDCAHAGDLTPKLNSYPGVYRDFAYVKAEVEQLAEQLVKL